MISNVLSVEDWYTEILVVMNIRDFKMTTVFFRKGCSCCYVNIDQGLSECVITE
jgi:hypothetical protein